MSLVLRADPSDPMEVVVERIVSSHVRVERFWSNPRGWAPASVTELMQRCRPDRQTQLARCLELWLEPGTADVEAGQLIMARINLGALVEGVLQLGLAVFHNDYARSDAAIQLEGKLKASPEMSLEELRVFYSKKFWFPAEAARWDPWIQVVQRRRNAVHAFRQRDIGTHADFLHDVTQYLDFLATVEGRFPYPE